MPFRLINGFVLRRLATKEKNIEIKLYQKNGTYEKKDTGEKKPYTNFYVKVGNTLVPINVPYFPNAALGNRDPNYSSRVAVLKAFAEELPEKEETNKNSSWKSANEFKKRKSSKTVGHPVLVYKKRGRYFKYLTFTHKPKTGYESDFEKLLHNIDPFDTSDCYVSKKYGLTNKNAFKDADKRSIKNKKRTQAILRSPSCFRIFHRRPLEFCNSIISKSFSKVNTL